MLRKIRLFFRQPFTENKSNKEIIKLNKIFKNYKKYPLDLLPYENNESSDFKKVFEEKTKIPFNPENFRNYRLNNIRKCNSMFIIRNNLSESTAFELGYIYSKYPHLPIFFAINNKSPIKTTLLKDLHPNVTYINYDDINDINIRLYNWLDDVAIYNNVSIKGGYHKYEIYK